MSETTPTVNDQTKNPEQPKTPPVDLSSKDKLVGAGPKIRLRKMEILRDTEVFVPDEDNCPKDAKGAPVPVILKQGQVVDLGEKEALRLVNKKVNGTYGFSGERTGDFPKQVLRAARPWTPKKEDVAKSDPLDPMNFQEDVV